MGLDIYTKKMGHFKRQTNQLPFLFDSETRFFFFFDELSWCVMYLRKLMSHCSSPLEFSSAFSNNSWKEAKKTIKIQLECQQQGKIEFGLFVHRIGSTIYQVFSISYKKIRKNNSKWNAPNRWRRKYITFWTKYTSLSHFIILFERKELKNKFPF